MSLENWLEDLLPTKWSRRVAFATVAASGFAYYMPSLLPSSFLPSSQEQVFLIKLLLLLLVACVGSLIVIFLVVRAYHAQAAAHLMELQAIQRAHSQDLESRANSDLHRPLKYPSLKL